MNGHPVPLVVSIAMTARRYVKVSDSLASAECSSNGWPGDQSRVDGLTELKRDLFAELKRLTEQMDSSAVFKNA